MEKPRARLEAIAAVIVLLMLAATAVWAGRFAFEYFKTAAEASALADLLMTANRGLPRTLDGGTRIDRVELRRRRIVLYHYTLLNYPARGPGVFEIYKNFGPLKAKVVKRVCALPVPRKLLEADYSILYRYKDSEENKLLTVTVRRADCG